MLILKLGSGPQQLVLRLRKHLLGVLEAKHLLLSTNLEHYICQHAAQLMACAAINKLDNKYEGAHC